ncbi:hypothetical protein CGRA01v4_07510 [Colletotrichum graminicola]|nr:hypothetical protein CGRA01v4_07510 [Colletotrichum graminicola]
MPPTARSNGRRQLDKDGRGSTRLPTGSPSRAGGSWQICWVTTPPSAGLTCRSITLANAVTDIRNLGPAFRPSADGNSVTLKVALCIRPGAQYEPRNEMTGRTSSAPSVVAQSTLVRKGSTSDPVLGREPHCCTGFDEGPARRWLLAGVARGRGALSYPVRPPRSLNALACCKSHWLGAHGCGIQPSSSELHLDVPNDSCWQTCLIKLRGARTERNLTSVPSSRLLSPSSSSSSSVSSYVPAATTFSSVVVCSCSGEGNITR